MKFIDVQCMTRRTMLSINIDKIILLKHYIINQSINGCGIVLEGMNDDHGDIIVQKTVAEVKVMINNAK
ncbi:MAG TPA: hypothetical protein VD996_00805 [Chitinophagaceae bacterium]|nr:hypothetical protein [Chitinophagaceae bacterium]